MPPTQLRGMFVQQLAGGGVVDKEERAGRTGSQSKPSNQCAGENDYVR